MFESHLETRHTKKTEAELAKRMMNEWKMYCSTFYEEKREEFEGFLKNQNFDYCEPGPIYYHSDKPLGIIMDRKFKMFASYVARLVVLGTPNDFKIISAYPEHNTSKLLYIGKYDFSDFDYEESCEKTVELFHLIRSNFYKCQLVKDTIKVYLPNTVVRVNTLYKDITIETSKDEKTGKHNTISYGFKDNNSVIALLHLIDNYQPKEGTSMFE